MLEVGSKVLVKSSFRSGEDELPIRREGEEAKTDV